MRYIKLILAFATGILFGASLLLSVLPWLSNRTQLEIIARVLR